MPMMPIRTLVMGGEFRFIVQSAKRKVDLRMSLQSPVFLRSLAAHQMKTTFLLAAMFVAANSCLAADSDAKAKITTAAKKLAEQANYSWTTTTTEADGG